MPPKRKRAEETAETSESTSTRATRSSARLTNTEPTAATKPKTATKSRSKKPSAEDEPSMEDSAPPATKKTKAKAVPSIPSKPAPAKKTKAIRSASLATDVYSDTVEAGIGKSLPNHSTTSVAKSAPQPPHSTPSKIEPYTPERALNLFKAYSDSDNPSVIAAEGFERLCNDAQIPLDGSLPMILSWQLGSHEMMTVTKDEWASGTESLKVASLPPLLILVSDLEQILLFDKKPLTRNTKKQSDAYDRTAYFNYAENPKAAFQKLYSYCFTLAKPAQSRNLDMETAIAFWGVLLVPKYPIISEILRFINEKEGVYKAANKDLWSMMLEFCETVKPSLEDYESDGAWPTLLDDFVAWKKSN